MIKCKKSIDNLKAMAYNKSIRKKGNEMKVLEQATKRRSGYNTNEYYISVLVELTDEEMKRSADIKARCKAYLTRKGYNITRFNSFSYQGNNKTVATFVTEQ